MKTIKLPIHNIVITLTENSLDKPKLYKAGTISSDLKKPCPYCEQSDCHYSCDESQAGGFNGKELETDDEYNTRRQYNTAIDAIESIILAHAVAGLDVEASEYLEGLNSALDKIANEFGD